MRRKIICLGVLALLSSCALAQTTKTTPEFELFGGYSYLRTNPGSPTPSANANGWNASLAWNWKRWVGVKADFDGHYCCNGQKEHNFLFGPQFTLRRNRVDIFFHTLGGLSHGNPIGLPHNAAAWDAGAGLDLKLRGHPRIALRLGQLDYLGTHYGGRVQNTLRFSTGIVFRFGKK